MAKAPIDRLPKYVRQIIYHDRLTSAPDVLLKLAEAGQEGLTMQEVSAIQTEVFKEGIEDGSASRAATILIQRGLAKIEHSGSETRLVLIEAEGHPLIIQGDIKDQVGKVLELGKWSKSDAIREAGGYFIDVVGTSEPVHNKQALLGAQIWELQGAFRARTEFMVGGGGFDYKIAKDTENYRPDFDYWGARR